MTFRKLEMGEIKLDKRNQDIISFIQGIINEFVPLIRRRNIHLNFNYDSPRLIIPFDSEKMERIVCNLMDNALKYTQEGGAIKIGIESNPKKMAVKSSISSDNEVVIKIFNSGPAFSRDELEKIFDRFYQGSSSGKSRSGFGIGLPLVKGLVELHQGSIKVENIPGQGKEFTIRIPKSSADEDLNVTPHMDTKEIIELDQIVNIRNTEVFNSETLNSNILGSSEKSLILIVEDDDDFREYLESSMNKNYRVITGSNGFEGLRTAIKDMPDLIISDIMMPKMDGLEFCRKLKKDLRTCHIPLILLTAKAEFDHRLEGLEIGADAYLTKPFIYKQLDLQVKNLINTRILLSRKFSSKDLFIPEEVYISKIDQEFLTKAILYVQNNIAEGDLNINVLSSHLCVSRRHLYRKIKVLTGSSPVEFINVIRLRKAMELLKENSHSISEVGYSVGYNNPSYFANSFKKLYGHPPSFFLK